MTEPTTSSASAGSVIRFLNLAVTDVEEREALVAALHRLLDHGRLVLGPEVDEFEARVAAYCGRAYCIGVGTGTDALILGLKALGIGPGDEVITTPLSWLATGSSILLNGAVAVFADVDESLNIDPGSIEKLIGPSVKAIMPVHFTGNIAAMDAIKEIAQRHGLAVIEDGSQAFGATLNGTRCGGFGDMACISLNAMKVLGGLGDAGVVLTDDAAVAERLRLLRHSGVVDRDYCVELSHNTRIDTLQAAMLLVRLDRLDGVLSRRRALAARYDQHLAEVVRLLPRLAGSDGAFYTYAIRHKERDRLRAFLSERNIETRIQHPVIMNDQPAFQGLIRGDSPVAAGLVHEILCLPIHEKLTDQEQDVVIRAVHEFAATVR